jgi:hypothetical protein
LASYEGCAEKRGYQRHERSTRSYKIFASFSYDLLFLVRNQVSSHASCLPLISRSMQQRHITLLEARNAQQTDTISADTVNPTINFLHERDPIGLQMEFFRRQRFLQFSTCAPGKCHCSCHQVKTRSGNFWVLKLPNFWNRCDKRTCSSYKNASIWISLNNLGIPYTILASFKFLFSAQQSYIAPSLRFHRVVDWDSPAFALLDIRDFDFKAPQLHFESTREQLTTLFRSGTASPLDTLPDGKSLVEVRQD